LGPSPHPPNPQTPIPNPHPQFYENYFQNKQLFKNIYMNKITKIFLIIKIDL